MKQRSEKYGPVYKESIGSFCPIVISDLDEYAKVIAVDGRYPNRAEMEPYAHYLRKRGKVIGIVNRCCSLSLIRLKINDNELTIMSIHYLLSSSPIS